MLKLTPIDNSPDDTSGDVDPIGKHEDLQRAAVGVPNRIVGFTALCSLVFALVLVILFMSGIAGRIGAILIAVIGVPILVMTLSSRTARAPS